MFNHTSVHSTQSIKINAVTGSILKNHPKSWFEQFGLKSNRAAQLLHTDGHTAKKRVYDSPKYGGPYSYGSDRLVDDPENNIIVLQMMICGDMEVIAECVRAKDFYGEEAPYGENKI